MNARWFQSDSIRHQLQSIAQALAWGGMLGMMLLALLRVSVAHASILPPSEPNFALTGNAVAGQFGFALAPAGDINGDGYADLLVGAYGERAIYVYAGSAQGFTHTAFFSSNSSQSNSFFGYSVDGGGDVNGDGVDDFIAGAHSGSASEISQTVGLVYVYHGNDQGLQPSLAITLAGETSGAQFGYSAALAGDVNRDGYTDLVVGAMKYDSDRGRVYLYHGSESGILPSPVLTLTGEASGDAFGIAVDGAGDVDGDGFDDVVVGARHNSEGGLNAGKVYVYFGSGNGIVAHDPFSVTGGLESEFGGAVAGAGDINGDGYDDLLVGAYRDDTTATDAGAAYLLWGSPDGTVTPVVAVAWGESADDQLGFAVNGAGDINGDGFDDLLAGAYLNDETDNEAGKAYGYSGCLGELTPSTVFSATGEYATDRYGRAVAGIGDVNGDGVDDIAVGAYGGKRVDGAIKLSTGKVFVYHGVKGGGCEAQIEMDVTLGLADYSPCSEGSTLDVPISTTVAACYSIRNSGVYTLTHHDLVDGIGSSLPAGTQVELAPGAVYTHVVTHTVSADVSWPITWTAGLPISGPGGAPSNPPGKLMTATASATATVKLLPADSDLDGDGVPDNEEGAGDADGDKIPAYLDPDEQPAVEEDPPTIYLPLLMQ